MRNEIGDIRDAMRFESKTAKYWCGAPPIAPSYLLHTRPGPHISPSYKHINSRVGEYIYMNHHWRRRAVGFVASIVLVVLFFCERLIIESYNRTTTTPHSDMPISDRTSRLSDEFRLERRSLILFFNGKTQILHSLARKRRERCWYVRNELIKFASELVAGETSSHTHDLVGEVSIGVDRQWCVNASGCVWNKELHSLYRFVLDEVWIITV